jgi:hypothetical protein
MNNSQNLSIEFDELPVKRRPLQALQADLLDDLSGEGPP